MELKLICLSDFIGGNQDLPLCENNVTVQIFQVGNSLSYPWTARGSNESILKEISPEYSLEGLMLKLKHQYFGHLMLRADLLEKTLMLWKIEGRRRRGRQRINWGWTISLAYCSPWGHKELDRTEQLNWETRKFKIETPCRVGQDWMTTELNSLRAFPK